MKKLRQRITTTMLALASVAAFVMGSAQAQLINVNFEQYTPGPGTFAVESELVGPAGGLNTRWNQFADEDSAGPLIDSTGAATTVEFTTNFSEGRSGGGGNTPMLRSTLTDFGRVQSRTLTITGLQADGFYDLWLTSFRDSTAVRERTAGKWTMVNATTSPSAQDIDNRSGRNGTSFVLNYNFALWESVMADGSGQIVVNGKGFGTVDGYDNDYRLGLSGIQIKDAPPREPLELTDIVHDDNSDEVTLTWKSNPGQFYGLYWSQDLAGFEAGINPAVPAHASGTRTSFGPFTNPVPGAARRGLPRSARPAGSASPGRASVGSNLRRPSGPSFALRATAGQASRMARSEAVPSVVPVPFLQSSRALFDLVWLNNTSRVLHS
jgi:hypothetical protein